ncbi:hypothetical protein F2Q68_00031064 [Brassica cretica]|uniref:Uncharacterized protein n=1 Tax=Brassica cretica TaxID=69181 RepID=A0A8S9GBL4_BRACR|nr:hypothetical protein F2Q68_00031064 [Brassica cretica]
MMKASTRLDSSHEQRRRRGAPGMNKGERRWVVSLKVAVTRRGKAAAANPSCSKRADATADLSGAIEAGNKEDFEKYSKRTVKVVLLVIILSTSKQLDDNCITIFTLRLR